jgi:hypothetical protein
MRIAISRLDEPVNSLFGEMAGNPARLVIVMNHEKLIGSSPFQFEKNT